MNRCSPSTANFYIFGGHIILDWFIKPVEGCEFASCLVEPCQTDKLPLNLGFIDRVPSLHQRIYFDCLLVLNHIFAYGIDKLFSLLFLLQVTYHFPVSQLLVSIDSCLSYWPLLLLLIDLKSAISVVMLLIIFYSIEIGLRMPGF